MSENRNKVDEELLNEVCEGYSMLMERIQYLIQSIRTK